MKSFAIKRMFFSYQVVAENNFRYFGHGILAVDVSKKVLNFDSCYEEIKEYVSEEREDKGLDPIDWTFWQLHILAFNELPG